MTLVSSSAPIEASVCVSESILPIKMSRCLSSSIDTFSLTISSCFCACSLMRLLSVFMLSLLFASMDKLWSPGFTRMRILIREPSLEDEGEEEEEEEEEEEGEEEEAGYKDDESFCVPPPPLLLLLLLLLLSVTSSLGSA